MQLPKNPQGTSAGVAAILAVVALDVLDPRYPPIRFWHMVVAGAIGLTAAWLIDAGVDQFKAWRAARRAKFPAPTEN